MCNQIAHLLRRAPLHTIRCGFAKLLRQPAAYLANLQDREGYRVLVVRIVVKRFKRIAIAGNRFLDFHAIIADMCVPLQIRLHHKGSPFPSTLYLGTFLRLESATAAAKS